MDDNDISEWLRKIVIPENINLSFKYNKLRLNI